MIGLNETKRRNLLRVRADKAAKILITLGGWTILLMLGSMIWHLMKVAAPLGGAPSLSIERQISLPPIISFEYVGDLLSGEMALGVDEQCHINAYQLDGSKQHLVKIHTVPYLCSSSIKIVEFGGQPILFRLSESGHLRIDQLRIEKQRLARKFLASMLIPDAPSQPKRWQVAMSDENLMLAFEQRNKWHVMLSKYGVVEQVQQRTFDSSSTIVLMPRLGRVAVFEQHTMELARFDSHPSEIVEFEANIDQVIPVSQDFGFFVSLENRQLEKWLLVNSEGVLGFQRSFVVKNSEKLLRYWQDERDHLGIMLMGQGVIRFINSVSGEQVKRIELGSAPFFSQKIENHLYFHQGDLIDVGKIENEGAAINFSSLWDKAMYAGYAQPDYVWQSTSSEGVEAKYSLIPLVVGSVKSAFYALLIAVPLSLGAAIYSGYFLSASNRKIIKPTIELLEAVPSVVIGFLLSVWLISWSSSAIFVLFFVILLCPLLILIWSAIQHYMAKKRQVFNVQDGDLWPIVAVLLVAIFLAYFIGSLDFWDGRGSDLLYSLGGDESSRKNTLVVAIALGIAITPTIYTLAEDAIHDVPLHYQQGSFALGATQLQTLQKVVLKVALPGLVSAVMLGFGRAFGETMIVLMVTGNTPIADWGLLSGLRTLGANLAIELPHSEVESGLYRILFLTALLLFFFTFVINTIAELIRNRFYSRYDNV